MGQAKRRGTYEQRKALAIEMRKMIDAGVQKKIEEAHRPLSVPTKNRAQRLALVGAALSAVYGK